jgi:hypothetical protein
MRRTNRNFRAVARAALVIGIPISVAACATTGAYPPSADIASVTEAKPRPPAEILTDPAANDRYNSAIEARGDRLYAAGARLCRFFARTGMSGLTCPKE